MICANRTDSPGFFTSCEHALNGPCICGEQVAADLIDQTMEETR